LMISLGAQYAMSLDGGGSSTMVVECAGGEPRVLNSAIDNYISGRERPVANHLGIFVGP
jgi:exopolysaccharide biosynthesis protein